MKTARPNEIYKKIFPEGAEIADVTSLSSAP